jgi:hypothetical protein
VWLLSVSDPYLRVVPLTVGIWMVFCLAAQEWVYPWPVWVGGPWGLILVMVSVAGVGRGEPARWAAEEERKRQAKPAKKERKRALKGAARQALPEAPGASERDVL